MPDKKKFLSTLCSTCESVIATLDYDEALRSVVKHAARCLSAKASSLRLIDKSGGVLRIAATFGLSEKYLKKGVVEISKSPMDKLVLQGKVVQVKDATKDKRIQYRKEVKREGIRSILCIPLRCRERVLGVLRIYTGREHTFNDDEIRMISTLAAQGAAIIKNARRYKRLKNVNEIGKAVTSQLNIRDVLHGICRYVTYDMSAVGALLVLPTADEGRMEIAASHGLPSRLLRVMRTKGGGVLTGEMTGRTVIVGDISRDKKVRYPREIKREGVKSLIRIPIELKNRIIGSLYIFLSYPYRMIEEDMEFLNILAGFGAVAIENARLHEHVKRDYEDLAKDVWKWYGWGERQPQI